MQRLVLINSDQDRARTSQDNSSISVRLPQAIPAGSKVSLKNAQIPYTYYNITDSIHYLSSSAGTLTLTSGQYTFAQLLLALTQVVGGNNMQFVYDSSINKVTAQYALPFTFTLDAVNAELFNILGFDATFFAGQSSNVIQVGNTPQGLFDHNIYVTINELSGPFDNINNRFTPTFCVPNTANVGEIVMYNPNSAQLQTAMAGSNVMNLTIQFHDEMGRLLTALSKWSIVLCIHQ